MLREYQDEITKLKMQLANFAMGGGGGGDGQQIFFNTDGTTVIEKIVKVEDEEKIRMLEEKLVREKDEIKRQADAEKKAIEMTAEMAIEEKKKLMNAIEAKEDEQEKAME